MALFRDRRDAGRELARLLGKLGIARPVVLGIPRGGVPIGAEIVRELGGELGVAVARKLGAPMQPELAIGAVTADGVAYINERIAAETGADDRYIDAEKARQAAEARRREEAFGGHRRPNVAGRDVVIADDGIATGATAIAALRSMRAAGAARVILAVPVGPPHTIEALRSEADEVACAHEQADFFAIGQFYDDFRPTEDEEVIDLLRELGPRAPAASGDRRATVVRDGVSLAVQLMTPAGEGPWPAVVFVHGLGSGKDSPRNVVVAARLVDSGIAAALFDLSGHGESSEDPRGEAAYPDDLAAVFGWAASQPELDGERIGVAGSSLGGVAAVEAVRRGLAEPRSLVLRAPPLEPGALTGLTVPSLLLAGERDPLLERIESAARDCPAATLSIVPGAGHLFEEPGTLEEATRRTVAWCEATLVARAGAPE